MTRFEGSAGQPLKMSYRPAGDGPEVDEVSIGGLLRRVAAESPQTIALVDGQPDPAQRRRWTYTQVLAEAEAVANWLSSRFEPGERVAIWAPNRPEWVLFQYGAALAGVVLVTVNPAYRVAELHYVLEQSRTVGLIHEAAYRGESLSGIVSEVLPSLPELRVVSCMDDWDDLVAEGHSRPCAVARRRPDRAVPDPVHVGHDRVPERCVAAPSGPDEQRRPLHGHGWGSTRDARS